MNRLDDLYRVYLQVWLDFHVDDLIRARVEDLLSIATIVLAKQDVRNGRPLTPKAELKDDLEHLCGKGCLDDLVKDEASEKADPKPLGTVNNKFGKAFFHSWNEKYGHEWVPARAIEELREEYCIAGPNPTIIGVWHMGELTVAVERKIVAGKSFYMMTVTHSEGEEE